jgi:2-hydroxy-3-keto-5-methylthiopentenyl-1-phosphate phosphatase
LTEDAATAKKKDQFPASHMNMKRTIFIDFDGTITRVDTCNAMLKAFASDGWQEINEQWERGELATQACARQLFQLFKTDMDGIKRLMRNIEIDPSFKDFLNLCRRKNYQVYVLSDGYDICIETVFENNGIKLPYYANKLIYGQAFQIQSPNINLSCGNCGTCKTRLMAELTEPGSQVVYIGDGYSDMCPVKNADLVFAKGTLYQFCLEQGISAIRYHTFGDIRSYLSA